MRERMRISPPSLDEEDAIVVQLYILLMTEEAAAQARAKTRARQEAGR